MPAATHWHSCLQDGQRPKVAWTCGRLKEGLACMRLARRPLTAGASSWFRECRAWWFTAPHAVAKSFCGNYGSPNMRMSCILVYYFWVPQVTKVRNRTSAQQQRVCVGDWGTGAKGWEFSKGAIRWVAGQGGWLGMGASGGAVRVSGKEGTCGSACWG